MHVWSLKKFNVVAMTFCRTSLLITEGHSCLRGREREGGREGGGRGRGVGERRGEALLVSKPPSWQRGQSGLNYRSISCGLVQPGALYNGASDHI